MAYSGTIVALLFFLAQIIFGLLTVDFFDPEKKMPAAEKIAVGFSLGAIISGFVVLIFSLASRSLYFGIAAFLIIFLLTVFLRIKAIRAVLQKITLRGKTTEAKNIVKVKNLWIVFIILTILFYSFFLTTILFRDKSGNLKAELMGWGDTAFHIDMIERFSAAEPFNLSHPGMGGANLTYPFFINFLSGIYLKLGAGLVLAFRLPLFLFGICSLFLLFVFAGKIIKSKNLAVLALLLVLLGSGLGFFTLFKDAAKAYRDNNIAGVVGLFANPEHEYTHLDNKTGGKLSGQDTNDNIVWITPVVSFLGHQRSFSVGLAVFSILLLAIYYYGNSRFFWRYGLIIGLLPFCHAHTFLAVFLMLAVLCWFFLKNWRSWSKFALAVLVVSIPQIIFLAKDSSDLKAGNFLKPWFGWMTCDHAASWFFCSSGAGADANPFIFWLKNFGVIFAIWVFILLVSFFFLLLNRGESKKFDYKFILASLFLFSVPNLFLLQPWPFDNNKLIFYWWIIAVIFCVMPCLKFLLEQNSFSKIIAVILIFFAVFAGGFDFVSRLFWTEKIGSFSYSDSNSQNVQMGQWISKNTAPNDMFLTNPAIDPVPLFLAGRPVYLFFEGWLWTQGLNYNKNEAVEKQILKGDTILACGQKIKYILLNDDLLSFYPETDEDALLKNTEIVFSQERVGGTTEILKVICAK